MLSSIGVTFGVLAAIETGWAILDPALAAIVALNILWSGWKVMTSSLSGLMDEAVPNDVLNKLREVISTSATGAIEAHDLRTRHAGKMTFIEFHLVVPGSMTVVEAHKICDDLELKIKEVVDHSLVTIHVEPENKAKHHGIVVL